MAPCGTRRGEAELSIVCSHPPRVSKSSESSYVLVFPLLMTISYFSRYLHREGIHHAGTISLKTYLLSSQALFFSSVME